MREKGREKDIESEGKTSSPIHWTHHSAPPPSQRGAVSCPSPTNSNFKNIYPAS